MRKKDKRSKRKAGKEAKKYRLNELVREKFTRLNDPRHKSYVKHKMVDVLIIIMLAVLSGLDLSAGRQAKRKISRRMEKVRNGC
jgi:hypothetical protein